MNEQTNKRPVVIVSSTARDLPEHRKEVLDACLRQGMFPVMMEHLPAADADAVEESLRMVDGADFYLGVFAHRYGHVPEGRDVSITEMEYERAVEKDIPRLVFLMDKTHPINIDDVEMGEGAAKLKAFKGRLEKERVVNYFNSPTDLRAKVIDALSRLRQPDLTIFHYADDDTVSPKAQAKKTVMPAKNRELMRVFVASPQDVHDERSRMPKVIDSFNRTLGNLSNVVIELWRWEFDATPICW